MKDEEYIILTNEIYKNAIFKMDAIQLGQLITRLSMIFITGNKTTKEAFFKTLKETTELELNGFAEFQQTRNKEKENFNNESNI